MGGPRGAWAAVPVSADQSPPLQRLRRAHGPLGDVYFYRAVLWTMSYRPMGQLLNAWEDLALAVRWPDGPGSLQASFRAAGAVAGEQDTLWSWEIFNGAILAKMERDRKRHADKTRAGRIGARKRRAARRQTQSAKRSVGRLVGRGEDSRKLRGSSAEGKEVTK